MFLETTGALLLEFLDWPLNHLFLKYSIPS